MNNRTKRPLEDLNLLDDFLMGAVASNEEVGPTVCRKMLSTFLNREIGEVRVVAQRTIPAATPKLRGIRMDVEVQEPNGEQEKEFPAMNIYDIEPHIPKDNYLPRRNRFYQAKVDGRYVASGERNFSKLPNLYVITITPYDPFGHGYMIYTVKNRCEEVPELTYEDGLKYLYLNSEGQQGGTEALREMLRYFADSREENATNEDLKEIHRCISKVKVQPEVEKEYMKFEEIIYYAKKEAFQEADKKRRLEDICELLEEYEPVPENLKERMEQEENVEILRRWLRLAAKVKSIEEFEMQM